MSRDEPANGTGTPRPGPGHAPAGTGLTAGTMARRLGVAVTTLRTWHQRYGLGPSGHQAGRHRRYTDGDLSRLELMRRLTSTGMSPHEAATVALSGSGTAFGTTPAPGPGQVVPPPDGDPEAGSRRDGGGWSIPVGRGDPAARGLARAAMRMDATVMRELVSGALRERGVIAGWTEVIVPVLVGVGARHAATGRLVEVEHLLTSCVSAGLAAVPRTNVRAPVRVLLGCADEEQHSLPLEALSAALAEAGVGHRMLGARVPPEAWRDAVRRTGPAVVVLWSQIPTTADPAQLNGLRQLDVPTGLLVALGPGWARPPADVATAATLRDAFTLVTSIVGGNGAGAGPPDGG